MPLNWRKSWARLKLIFPGRMSGAYSTRWGLPIRRLPKSTSISWRRKPWGCPAGLAHPCRGASPRPPVKDRHASPVHIHLAPRKDGKQGWTVRIVAFPSAYLPNLETSREFLTEFLKDVESDLRRRAGLSPPRVQRPASSSPAAGSTSASTASLLSPGNTVKAMLLEEKTKKAAGRRAT